MIYDTKFLLAVTQKSKGQKKMSKEITHSDYGEMHDNTKSNAACEL